MLNHKTRFAPSPNGKLHIGHAFSAIISEKIAKKYDGEFLVRIEDIDASRSSKKNIKRIIDDLKWLNIKFEDNYRLKTEEIIYLKTVFCAKKSYTFCLKYDCLKFDKRTVPNKKILVGKIFEIDKRRHTFIRNLRVTLHSTKYDKL